MRPALVVLVLLLPLAAAGPVGDAPDGLPEGSGAATCPAPCYDRTDADHAQQQVLAFFVFHDRDTSSRGLGGDSSSRARMTERFAVPIVLVASDATASDDAWKNRHGTRAIASARSLHLIAEGAPGVLVLDAGRSYAAGSSKTNGSAGFESDQGGASLGAKTQVASTSGDAGYARQTSYGASYSKTTETLAVKRQVVVLGSNQTVDLTMTLVSNHLAGVATLTLRGHAAGRIVDTSIVLPLDLP